MQLARARLADLAEHLRILAADADSQNAWLHPCGWTRAEPFEHLKDHPPCVPTSELLDSLNDMWPSWRSILEPVLTPALTDVLDGLVVTFGALPETALTDELDSLDRPEWFEVRRVARRALERAESQLPVE